LAEHLNAPGAHRARPSPTFAAGSFLSCRLPAVNAVISHEHPARWRSRAAGRVTRRLGRLADRHGGTRPAASRIAVAGASDKPADAA